MTRHVAGATAEREMVRFLEEGDEEEAEKSSSEESVASATH